MLKSEKKTSISIIERFREIKAPDDFAELSLMQGTPPSSEKVVTRNNWIDPPYNRWAFQHVRELMPTATISRGHGPISNFKYGLLNSFKIEDDTGNTMTLEEALEKTYSDAFIVLHRGKVVYEKYYNCMKPSTPHQINSITKTFIGTLTELLAYRGQIDMNALVSKYVPELSGSAYGDATIRQVMDMVIGAEYEEGYHDPDTGFWQYCYAIGTRLHTETKYENLYEYLPTLKKGDKHGETFLYTTPNTEVLAWIIRRVTGKRLTDFISEEICSKLGMEQDAYMIVDSIGHEVAGYGMSITLRDLARYGQMMLQNGFYNGQQIIPAEIIKNIQKGGSKEAFQKSDLSSIMPGYSYHSQWFVTHNEHNVFWHGGIHGQRLTIDPIANMVIVRMASFPIAADNSMRQLYDLIDKQLGKYFAEKSTV